MPVMKQLRIGSATYDTVGEASVTQVQTSGTKIATVTIDGTATDLYAPEGGGSGPEPSSTTPAMDGTAAVGTATTYARADHVHPSDTSKQDVLVSGTSIKSINNQSLLGSGILTVRELPDPREYDNGCILMIVNGYWTPVLPKATDTSYGMVMVDGTSITATNGVISVAGSVETYEITIALTNPLSGSDFHSCNICYFDGSEAAYPPISTLDSPSGSTTVDFDPAQYQQLALEFDTNWGLSFTELPVCTGDVALAGWGPTGNTPIFNVAGNGSITIDGIDYGD